MTALSIRQMNWTIGQRELILDAQLQGAHIVRNTSQTTTSHTPADPIEELKEKICKELLFIAKYKSNYRRLAVEALSRAKWYRRRIAELKEANEPIN